MLPHYPHFHQGSVKAYLRTCCLLAVDPKVAGEKLEENIEMVKPPDAPGHDSPPDYGDESLGE